MDVSSFNLSDAVQDSSNGKVLGESDIGDAKLLDTVALPAEIPVRITSGKSARMMCE